MKKLLVLAFVLGAATAANAAWNQECFYGKCCADGVIDAGCSHPVFCERKCILETNGREEILACKQDCVSKRMMCERNCIADATDKGGFLACKQVCFDGKKMTEKDILITEKEEALVLGKAHAINGGHFDTDKADLTPRLERYLTRRAHELKKLNYNSVLVTGYTDNTGEKRFNDYLSNQRAKTVADYLIKQGVPAAKVKHEGKGSANPVADNNTHDGRAANRRVEILVK